MRQQFTDEGDARKYWTQLPNIIFEIGLKPLELVLYAHIKRAAGASDSGKCFKSTATLARETGMGAGTVSRTKTALEARRPALRNKPLIRTREVVNPRGGKPFQEITITDIWKDNTDYFSSSSVEVASSSVEIERQNQVPVEVGSSSKPISTVEIKNNLEEEQEYKEEKKPLSPHARLMDFQQMRTGPIANGARDGKAAKWLLDHGYDPLQCEQCFDYLLSQTWRTSPVSWITVQTNIGPWLNGHGNGKPKNTTSENTGRDAGAGQAYDPWSGPHAKHV